jgi:hypothetical protein
MEVGNIEAMWTIEDLPGFEQLAPADQLWIIALAIEENGGPAEYVRALRKSADRLDELGWWLSQAACIFHCRGHH